MGERAAGYGVMGRIAAMPDRQPLTGAGVWRVVLAGESVVRLVRQDEEDYQSGAAGWVLLQLDDIAESLLDGYDAMAINVD